MLSSSAIRNSRRRAPGSASRRENQAKLKREIEALGDDRRALNQQLIDTAAHVRGVEASIEATEGRLKPLDEQERLFQKSLDERRAVIIEILAALQRVGHQPPPALMVRPEDALQAVRMAIMLGAVLPEMRAQAEALAGDLADLLRVRNDIVAERDHLARDLAQLGHDQLRMNMLIDERQSKQSNAEQALDSERQRAADLARQVDGLKDLIGKLEANLDSANRAAHLAARAAEEGRPDVAALKRPRAAGPGGRVRRHARPLAAAGKRGQNPRIRHRGRLRRNPEGRFHRHPHRRANYRALRRLGGLRGRVSQLWATLDPECRRRLSCFAGGDGAHLCRSRPVRADR